MQHLGVWFDSLQIYDKSGLHSLFYFSVCASMMISGLVFFL